MNHFIQGMGYFFSGMRHVFSKGLKRFILIPLLFNILLFSGLFYFIYHYVLVYSYYYLDKLPSWLSFLSTVFLIIFILSFCFFFLVTFTVFFNLIAAPFNSLLAEKAQYMLYNIATPSQSFYQMTVRTIKRQGEFLKFFIPKLVVLCILFFIPLVQPVYPFLWFIFTAWILSIQYQDFTMDNNLMNFDDMKNQVKKNKLRSLGFGFIINLCSFIPILNIILMPAAVIGGVIFFCDNKPE